MVESIKSSNLNNADSLYSRFPGDNVFSKWVSEALANCFCTSCIDMLCQDIQHMHRDYTICKQLKDNHRGSSLASFAVSYMQLIR